MKNMIMKTVKLALVALGITAFASNAQAGVATKYSILIDAPDNGEVTTNPSGQATQGSIVQINATPDTGYEVDSILAWKSNNYSTKVTVGSDGKFTMPSYNVTVSVSFKEAKVNVSYVDVDGTTKQVDATVVGNDEDNRVTWNAGWYVVNSDVAIPMGADCSGAVNLILADGAKLTISGVDEDKAGIKVSGAGNSLAIYGQSAGTGELNVTGGADGGAGIGGGLGGVGSYITIGGGTVMAIGGGNDNDSAPGIGSGVNGDASSNIFVADNLALKADGNNPPTTEIAHDSKTDVASSLAGKRYAQAKSKYTCVREVITGTKVLEEGKTYTAVPTTSPGGAFNLAAGATLMGTNVTFAGNEVFGGIDQIGGAINNENGTVALHDATFTGNKAGVFGGAIFSIGTLSLDGVTFEGNTATFAGGAIYNFDMVNFDGPVALKTATDTICNVGTLNWNLTGGKAGVLNGYQNLTNDYSMANEGVIPVLQLTIDEYTTLPTNIVIATGDFSDVTSKDTFTIKNTTIKSSCSAKINGGFTGISGSMLGYKLETVEAGDTTNLVLHVEEHYTCVREVITGTKVLEEDMTYTAAPTTSPGGAFYVNAGATLVGTNVTFAGNESEQHSGAICNNGTLALKDAVFTGNTANQIGGAIVNAGILSLDGVIFDGNKAECENFALSNGGVSTGNLDGAVTLVTEDDAIYNFGTLNWNLTGGKQGVLNGYDKLTNSGTLKLTIEDYATLPKTFVIATGDFSNVKGKDTFTVTNATTGVTATVKIGDTAWTVTGERRYKLTCADGQLKLTVDKLMPTIIPTEVTGAKTVNVYTNGTVEVAGPPYVVELDAQVKVTYTADEGYFFAGGKTTWTTNFTANAATVTVTIPESEQPTAAVAKVGDTYYASINEVFATLTNNVGHDVTVKILRDFAEVLTNDYLLANNVTITTDVEGGVTADFGFREGKDVFGIDENLPGTLTITENVAIKGLGQLVSGYGTLNNVVNIAGDLTAGQVWAYKGIVNVLPTAKVVATYGKGDVSIYNSGTVNVEGTGTNEVQVQGISFLGKNNGDKSFVLSNTFVKVQCLTNEYKSGSFTLNLDSARFEADGDKGMDFGTKSVNTINMTADSFIATSNLTNLTAINIDATDLEGEVKVIDILGNQAMTLESFGTVTVTGGKAYVEDNDLWVMGKCIDCITFSADSAFGIKLVKGTDKKTPPPTVALEYSTDQLNWQTFNVDTDYAAEPDGETYKLHIRGTGNSKFAAESSATKAHCFTNTVGSAATEIACSGNIMTLLDYETVAKGEEPTMGDYAFFNLFIGFAALTSVPALPATTLAKSCYLAMFRGCTSLTNAPALPAMTLAESCYMRMFQDCTSLTAAPALPAATLAEKCYCYMFYGCTSLTAAPALPATTLAANCYRDMFNGCTSLVVNKAAPGKEWKIPATTGEGAANWGKGMFTGTGGDIPSPPALNTTYYVKSDYDEEIELGDNLKAYTYGNGQIAIEGAGELKKAGADLIKDKGVTNLVVGAGVTNICANAFDGWRSLRDVQLGADCTTVGSQAFLECFNLTNVTSKATGAITVGDHAFYRCNSLESMNFGVLPTFGTQSYTLQAGIYMEGGMPQIYPIPEISVTGYRMVLLGSTDFKSWTEIKTEQEKANYNFFKLELQEIIQ